MKKVVIKLLVICILILMTLLGLLIVKLNENNRPTDFFAMHTYNGFNDIIKNTKYKITNQKELEMFYTLYNGFKLSKDYNLSKNTIFIQTQAHGSGSISVNFNGVSIDKEVKFDVSTDIPKICTMDMAYWYLVAIVPNTKLNGVNVNEWRSPIDVNNSLCNEYTVFVECTNFDLENSLNIVEKAVKDIGDIKIKEYNYSPIDNKKSYMLISYDEKISNKFVQSINNQENGMRAEIFSTKIKDESEYKNFQETLNQPGKPFYQINLWSAEYLGGITYEKGEEIAEMFNADEILQNTNGHLNIKINDFSIEKVKSNMNIISQYKTEWVLKDYRIDVHWEY